MQTIKMYKKQNIGVLLLNKLQICICKLKPITQVLFMFHSWRYCVEIVLNNYNVPVATQAMAKISLATPLMFKTDCRYVKN